MKAEGKDGRVTVEMSYEEAADLGDVLAALIGPLFRFLGEPLRGFTTVMATATWQAAPVVREEHDDEEDDDEG